MPVACGRAFLPLATGAVVGRPAKGQPVTKPSPDCGIRQASVRFGLVYWGGAFLISTVLYFARVGDAVEHVSHAPYIAQKIVRHVSGWVLTSVISYLLFRMHGWAMRSGPSERSLPMLVVSALLLSLAAAPVWAALGHVVQAAHPLPQQAPHDWNGFIGDTALGAALFFGWSGLFISLLFSFELHERGRRLAAAREEALSAQMRALRYQVHPHFLFNTLNSIAGLIEEGSAAQAERMVLSLSTFLRKTLSLDPMQDVSLADEMSLQEEYLEIECKRFSDRMAFDIAMPEEVRHALVPSLILQPLIENAVKHGVGRSRARTRIGIRARRQGASLCIAVENDLQPGVALATGLGIGLRNVAERLRVRFGDVAALRVDGGDASRFRVEITLPWRAP